MQTFLVFLVIAVNFITAEIVNVDWSKVKPITDYPEFWTSKGLKYEPNYQGISERVSNGNLAGRHDFPFKTALITSMPFGDALCGASLISRMSVLTAASCLDEASSAVVILGAHDLRDADEPFQVRFRVQSANFRIHQFYRAGISNSDIGIVRLNHAIAFFNQAVRPVELPRYNDNNLYANVNGIGMGFGRYSANSENFSYNLRFIEVLTMSNNNCNSRFPRQIDHSHLCTSGVGGRGFCQGDVGSPLVLESNGQYIQIGVASLFPNSGCTTNNPSVYTRITSFQTFIQMNML